MYGKLMEYHKAIKWDFIVAMQSKNIFDDLLQRTITKAVDYKMSKPDLDQASLA